MMAGVWSLALLAVASVVRLTPADLEPPDGKSLAEGWIFRAGDDPSWGSIGLDDSSWTPNRTLMTSDAFPKDWNGVGWFRLHLELDPEIADRELALIMVQGAALEIWADGEKLLMLDGRHDGPSLKLLPTPHRLAFAPGRSHVIAIRVELSGWRTAADWGFPVGFRTSIAPLAKAIERAAVIRERGTGIHRLFIGLSSALAILFLLLHLYHREKKHNLYFATLNIANATIEGLSIRFLYSESYDDSLLLSIGLGTAVVVISSSLMFVVGAVFRDRTPRGYRWLAYLGIPVVGLSTLGHFGFLYAYSMICILEGVRTVGVAIYRKQEGSLVIGAGFFVVGVGVTVQAIHDLGNMNLEESNAAAIGLLGLLFAMCIQLARDFANTHAAKVEEERRAKRAEVERVRLEEENKRHELALEDARKIEAAHRELAEKHRQLQETQAKLVQSEKMASLGRLVAGVAHEINTPIGAMNSAHDSLRRAKQKLEELLGEKAPPELKSDRRLSVSLKVIDDSAKVLDTGGERIAKIVSRLRSFARLDQAELQRVDIHQGIEDTLAMAAHELGANIEVVKSFSPDLPQIVCNPGQLNQVLLNVLINAKQAISDRGRIEIATERRNGSVVVSVKDDGCGIPDHVLPRVFEPGFTTKGVGVGMGLGLSIAYRVIEDHGGQIEIQSAVGRGTEVTMTLPIERKA
jgi:signal transduction histidine kinase